MKKIILIILCILFITTVKAQSYYKMYTAESGGGETISNSQMWFNRYGIQFSTQDICRGMITADHGEFIIFPGNSNNLKERSLQLIDANKTWGERLIVDAPAVAKKFIVADYSTPHDNVQIYNDGTNGYICANGDDNGFHIKSNTAFKIHLHDQVGIGTTGLQTKIVPGAQLTVSGAVFIGSQNFPGSYNITSKTDKFLLWVQKGIVSENFALAKVADWSDHVFQPNYSLRPLSEVKQFIDTNKHLPDVPSEKEVKEKGYNIHDMNKVFMQKIEELTLYVIQQQKEIDALKEQLNNK